jgi:hypothetical protein
MAEEALVKGRGALKLVPRDDDAVMEPRVTKTISAGSTWISPVPFLLKLISSTVILEDSENDRLVTLVSL